MSLNQEIRPDNIIYPQAVSPAATVQTNAGMYRSMAKYRMGLMIITAQLTAGKTAIAQLTCASDSSGTGKADVTGKTVTITGTTSVPSQVGTIGFDCSDLTGIDQSKYWAGCDITTNQDGDSVQSTLIRSAARYYEGSNMPS